ncbi:MAG: thioredoxin family protein [Gemmatimonadaceae bacterium]|nr:thioredoxin family protein [Gemmatimonadaceae bacterium]
MITTLLLAATLGAAPCMAADSLDALYAAGKDFPTFLAAAEARKELWTKNTTAAQVPADVLRAARALPKGWRLLAIAIDGCSDSVNTIPFVAKLVSELPGWELRIVPPSGAGRGVMESHRTDDGRAATPTVVLLDREGRDVGCWIERPVPLRRWLKDSTATAPASAAESPKQFWYTRDAGAETVREIVEMVAAAARGERRCR